MSSIPNDSVLPDPNEPLLSLPEVADLLGVVITRVHDLLNARKIIALNRDGKRMVPARFFDEDKARISRFVPGCITVLSDGGYSDEAIFRYLFSEDDSLPGRPIDALHGHLAREVMRRAQAMAF